MALRDTACYTLTIVNSSQDPTVIDLVESQGGRDQARYARVKEKRDSEAYSACIYDPSSGAKLASFGYVREKDKSRRLQLHGPDERIPFEVTAKLSFQWSFTFEGNTYHWNRQTYGKDYICTLDRKPDPAVEICLAREAAKLDPARLQILHYNIERFPYDIRDLRGLETLLVSTLICLIDANEQRNPTRPSLAKAISSSDTVLQTVPPPPPEKVITEDDFDPENPNEIIVGLRTELDSHIARAIALLEDPHVLFVVIRTKDAAAAQRALEVSLGITRYRHHENLGDLRQYVIEEDDPPPPSIPISKGPKIIKLDDEASPRPTKSPDHTRAKDWRPPKNLAIYLSSIELPDLSPARRATMKCRTTSPQPPTSQASPSQAPVRGPSPVGDAKGRVSSEQQGKSMSAEKDKEKSSKASGLGRFLKAGVDWGNKS